MREIVELLRTYSSNPQQDIPAFLDAIALNWLIAGTDAHAKNYAILIGSGGQTRMAPFYDMASVLAYKDFDPQRLRLAMQLGGNTVCGTLAVASGRNLPGKCA